MSTSDSNTSSPSDAHDTPCAQTSGGLCVIAMGGHSLLDPAKPPTLANQFEVTSRAVEPIAALIARGERLVLTHGNGPQVGFKQLRSILASEHVHEVPLDVLVADTQGSIGYMIQRTLRDALVRHGVSSPVAAVVTEVAVSADDPSFADPSKPIGQYYTREEAERHQARWGWSLVEVPRKGWRRVVPSPAPKAIVQLELIQRLLAEGAAVIACGGGGIPVCGDGKGGTLGLEAVIDKDRTSALLAVSLGAERFVITTAVDGVYKDFDSDTPTFLPQTTPAELRALADAGQFPRGSMGPKVEAAITFLAGGGREVIICHPDGLVDAFEGKAGTRVVPT